MKNFARLLVFSILSLSCNDNTKHLDNSDNIIDTVKPNKKQKLRAVVDKIYDEEGVKIYGDTTIEKKKIYYASIKFEPYINFSDFKVNIENAKAKIDLNSNELGREFRTVIKQDYENPESVFAGHYTLASWGCGSPCQMSVIVDRRNGKIYESPPAALGYKFQKDSRMLIVNPPDSLNYYDNCSYCKPEIYILNEATKKFEQRKPLQ